MPRLMHLLDCSCKTAGISAKNPFKKTFKGAYIFESVSFGKVMFISGQLLVVAGLCETAGLM